MDSVLLRDGRLMDLVDGAWARDTLPSEDISVPAHALPELEGEGGGAANGTGGGGAAETLQEQEDRWTDLALPSLLQQSSGGGGSGGT